MISHKVGGQDKAGVQASKIWGSGAKELLLLAAAGVQERAS